MDRDLLRQFSCQIILYIDPKVGEDEQEIKVQLILDSFKNSLKMFTPSLKGFAQESFVKEEIYQCFCTMEVQVESSDRVCNPGNFDEQIVRSKINKIVKYNEKVFNEIINARTISVALISHSEDS
jgi:hypothetical protein